jgi:hypothetical protein
LLTGLKERNRDPGSWIDTAEVGSLVQVAVVARPGKVFLDSGTTVLSRHDMFAVESKERVFVLMRAAILASIFGSLANEVAKVCIQSNPLRRRCI